MIEEKIKLTELIDVSILQKMQDAFAKMARMAALTADENGVAVTEPTNFTDLCTEFCRKSPIGKARCEYCDKMGAVMSLRRQQPVSYKCHANLVDFAAPIMLGDEMIGSFIGGQVLSEAPDIEQMKKVAKEIKVDEEAFVQAALKTQIIPQAAIDRSTEFIYEFAKIISDMAYNSYVSKQLSKEAMQATIQKSDFLANMSHEIRTPMNAVLGMAEMALRKEMSKEAREYVEQIKSSGKHLLVIINDILDFSKIDSGKMEIIETFYKTENMLQDISNFINSRIGDKDLEFIIDVPYDMPIEMYGDSIRIQQVLINLLTNAVKFTTRGKITLKMSFEDMGDDNVMVQADIIDTGNGIKEEDKQKLFQSFQQVDSKRNRNIEGTGLGLAISKQLIELMNGTISVESEYGKGSTFTIRYPQRVQTYSSSDNFYQDKALNIYLLFTKQYVKEQILKDLAPIHANITDLEKQNVTPTREDSYFIIEQSLVSSNIEEIARKYPNHTYIIVEPYNALNNFKEDNIKVLKKPIYSKVLLTALGFGNTYVREDMSDDVLFSFIAPEAQILVVDDNPINLSVVKGLLEPLEMKVDTAESAAKCIEMLNTKAYDIIFMDHMMPEVDGVEATHIIRRMIGGYEDVPIIALTANAVGGVKEMFLKEGMNDFVAKPIETQKLVAKIKHWLPKEKMLPVSQRTSISIEEIVQDKNDIIRIEGLNVQSGMKLLGSEKLYMKILKEFYMAIDRRANIIKNSFNEKNYEIFTIEVHSLKSTSKQIGADSLSAFAAQMEKAGHEGNISYIASNIDALLFDYHNLQEKLRQVFEHEIEKDMSVDADKSNTISCIDELLTALEEIDSLAIEEALSKFNKYIFVDDNEREFLEQIRKASDDFDIDICAELARKWKAYIE